VILKRNLYFINRNPSERHHDMVTATETGKQRMNSLPLAGLQRKKEYIVNTVTNEWSYKHPFMHKVYCCLMDFGDMPYHRCKVAIREPTLYEHIYDEVRQDMLEGGRLLTAEEAAENRKHKDKKKFDADVARVQAEGIKKLEKEATKTTSAKPTKELIGPEIHAPMAGSTGTRNGTVMEAALASAKPEAIKSGAGRGLSPDAARIKKNFETYTLSQLKTLGLEDYKRQKGHYPKSDTIWYNHRRATIERLEKQAKEAKAGPVVETPAQPQQAPVVPVPLAPAQPEAPKTRKAFNVLGAVSIADLQPEVRKVVKGKIAEAMAILGKENGSFTLATLDDPPEIEIREVVWY
jgi:hypothetical protein